jgi:hypothetical protein
MISWRKITKLLLNMVEFKPLWIVSVKEAEQRHFAQGLVIQSTKLHQLEVLFR